MRTLSDPRHRQRVKIVTELFAKGFSSSAGLTSPKILEISTHQSNLDSLISQAAPQFPVAKISRIDVAILRLALYELTIEKTAPPKVVIDEAVELGKQFGGETSPGFINGVLGTVLKEYILNHD
jgi:transcription antitermination factor NusB